jgi:hypothetical protein
MYSSARQSKPWPGVEIDWNHPLAQGLQFVVPFNEGSGKPIDVVNRVVPTSAAQGWSSGIDGWCATFDGTSTRLSYPAPQMTPFPGISVLVRVKFTTVPFAANQGLVERCHLNANWSLYVNNSNQVVWDGHNPRLTWTQSGITAGTWCTLVATDDTLASNTPFLYLNGALVATTTAGATQPTDSALQLTIGSSTAGDNVTPANYLNGSIGLVIVANRKWSAAEVADISANPWQVFRRAWPRGRVIKASTSFTITENNLPAHHAGGTVTVHAVGFNTLWTSGTVFTLSGISGWSIASKSFVDSTHVTLVLSCPASGGSTGTLSFSDGTHLASAGVNAPAMSCNPTTVQVYDQPTVTFIGTATLWQADSPTFAISGGKGATIGPITASSNTSATAVVYAGSQAGATLTITDPSTGSSCTITTPNTVVTNPYVTRSGELLAFVFGNSSNAMNALTALNALPTVKVNGQAVTPLGPFSGRNYFDPFIFFKLPSNVAATDVVTFSASSGWVTTAAGAAPAYTNGLAPNYTGKLEAPLFGELPFDYLPSGPTGTLQVGFNQGKWTDISPFVPGFEALNYWKRGAWASGIGTYTTDGRPVTITNGSGNAQYTITNSSDNYVDGLHYPEMTGVWTFVADETSPATPMKAWIQVGSNAAIVTSGPTSPSAPTIAGTLVNGVLVGQTWQWTIAYKGSPTDLGLGINVLVQTPTAAAGNYTLTNEWMFPPSSPNGPAPLLSRGTLEATDPNFLRMATAGTTGVAVLRDLGGGIDGAQSNIVNVSDLHALTDASWRISKSSAVANITQIRAYSLGTSPNVYFANHYTGSSVNNSGSGNLAYQWAPADIGYSDTGFLGYGYFIGECVCSAPHGLYTGQKITWGGTMPTISVTNGNLSPINYTFGDGGSGGATLKWPVFVTGATTFAFWAYSGSTTMATLVRNTVATTYNVPGGSPFTATVKAQDGGSILPPEINAQAVSNVPGCAAWAGVPLLATDATVTHIAQVWVNHLSPDRLCYVEVCNEPWNYGFWQNPPFHATILNMAGAPWNTMAGFGYGGYVLRALQVANVFRSVWQAAGRDPNQVRSLLNGQSVNNIYASMPISLINTYNAANPGSPYILNAIAVAPYVDAVTGDTQANPTALATVSATGGGASGGSLAAGNYYAAYTYVDSLTGMESAAGSSESAQFTVASGNKPRITFNDTLPSWAASRNVYLTAAGGAAGSEVKYATGVTAATYDMVAANAGSAHAPTNNMVPTYNLACASIAASDATSVVNTTANPGNAYAANPWSIASWCDYLRHLLKYNSTYSGSAGYLKSFANCLPAYNAVGNQPPLELITYEGSLETLVPTNIQLQSTLPSYPVLTGKLTHDVFYHPEMYYVELAYLQLLQSQGIKRCALEALQDIMYEGNLGTAQVDYWSYAAWAGQKAGRGDNSDAKGTNQLWINTGASHHLTNVSPRLQAVYDWLAAGNNVPPGQFVSVNRSPMIRSAARHGRHGAVMTRVHLPPASSPDRNKRWFPGISPTRRNW